ncbi:HCP-like protein [Xylariaceae sp. FL1272]|nr:HCP-like protein [Xylariaceae sp. FL1272]
MGLRDMIKKKDRLGESDSAYSDTLKTLEGNEFKFIRTTTTTQEPIYPEDHPTDHQHLSAHDATSPKPRRHRLSRLFQPPRSRGSSFSDVQDSTPRPSSHENGLARRMSFHNRKKKTSSEFVPDLPAIDITNDESEPQWEKRATILASTNEERRRSKSVSGSPLPSSSEINAPGYFTGHGASTSEKAGVVSSVEIDRDIQEAIRLHEEGEESSLEKSTRMFERLADPNGANNPLSQVLFGLALRHGWGCEADPARAITYLSLAAANSASIENKALAAGQKKGGAAKGELVLSIFELANCFRHGWGIPRDPVAAKHYYETAANLGDTDAMNEVAWCYLEGFGCKKDKFQSAKYYRLAEKNGSKTIGNTWIWKEKYDAK